MSLFRAKPTKCNITLLQQRCIATALQGKNHTGILLPFCNITFYHTPMFMGPNERPLDPQNVGTY